MSVGDEGDYFLAHFAQARGPLEAPADQRAIPEPRLGFLGVIDGCLDMDLLGGLAAARPDWHVVLVGPIVGLSLRDIPQRPNLHLLGAKAHAELPAYLSGWDVALLPYARDAAMHYIGPTAMPEYLAAGRPVVATPVRDVVRPYGEAGIVRTAAGIPDFVEAVEAAMHDAYDPAWQARVAAALQARCWEPTLGRREALLMDSLEAVPRPTPDAA
jgi:UDP-galactopyranose mutase